MMRAKFKLNPQRQREYPFVPRIINPIRLEQAVIFAADEQLRSAVDALPENLPWMQVDMLNDPLSATNYHSPQPKVIIFDDVALNTVNAEEIRKRNRDVILVLLSYNPMIHCSPPTVMLEQFPYAGNADLVFAVDRDEFAPEKILPSIVRCAEDRLNIEKYSRARRFIFLIVDDEPRWFSQFLPVLYNIIGQRAAVMLTRTYEETLRFLFGVEDEAEIYGKNYHLHGHGDDVVCVITDIFFPKGDNPGSDAGRRLTHLIKNHYPRIPVIVASKAREGDDLRELAFIMPKGDIGSLDLLKNYLHDFTGMGDFLIQNKSKTIYHRVKNIQGLYEVIVQAEHDLELRQLLEVYGQNDFFSTWLYMHGFRELADFLRPRQDRGQRMITVLKRSIQREMLRTAYTPLIIEDTRVFTLDDLLLALRTKDPTAIQYLSDHDYFSIWLDRHGYTELAEEIRPIHGSGMKLEQTLARIVEKWKGHYEANPYADNTE
ncbi:MAG: hypothetical protein ONB16_09405 [candidate division KSB1 bacterium]|nr:hypothetical protein [candidate division KSB1 bacterium]MDZ7319058.1 hypothetical protein [candidate division KSB1 bacterium]MDZ7341607.1 hypothetical protein [candidate division KSB1 bacterium]